MRHQLTVFCLLVCAHWSVRADLQFESPAATVPVLELYTSQGCSSCPPAERWLARFTSHPGLWEQVIPLAFHVDYWDALGWPDRFAAPAFSRRQRAYRRHGRVSSVYTPGFVLAGREWRGWFQGADPDLRAGTTIGRIRLRIAPGQRATIGFNPVSRPEDGIRAYFALLGFGLTSRIGGGENAGHTLTEDFVVLGVREGKLLERGADLRWTFDWPEATAADASRMAVAAWVSRGGDPTPLQAVAGWLP